MNDTKPWHQSTGVWGGLAAIIGGIGMLTGINIDTVTLTESLFNLGSLIGGALALFGRIRADKRIG